jgi:hypothetical protein
MGFHDDHIMLALLVKHKGDVNATCLELLR